MGVTIHELRGIITANVSGFVNGLKQAGRSTHDLAKAWADAADKIGSAATRMATIVTAFSAGTTIALAKTGLQFLALQEQALTAFTTMLGSGEKAKAFLADLVDFAARTPFELPGLVSASQKLLAFGFEAEKIVPMLTAIGDAAAGLGGGPALIDQITRSLGQMQAKGKVSAEEMLQLAEAGIPAWQLLADTLGVTIPEAMARVTAGTVSAEVAIEGILAGMTERFGGMMDQQAKSMLGMLSTLSDTVAQYSAQIVEPLFGATKNVLDAIFSQDAEGRFSGTIERLKGHFADLAKRLDEFTQNNLNDFLDDLAARFEDVIGVGTRLAQWVIDTGPRIVDLAESVGELVRRVMQFIEQHPRLFAFLAMLKGAQILGITEAVKALGVAIWATGSAFSSWNAASGLAVKAIGGVATALTRMWTLLTVQVVPTIIAFFSILRTQGVAAAGQFAASIVQATLKMQLFAGALGFMATGGIIAVGTALVLKAADAFGVFGEKASSAAEQAKRAADFAKSAATEFEKTFQERRDAAKEGPRPLQSLAGEARDDRQTADAFRRVAAEVFEKMRTASGAQYQEFKRAFDNLIASADKLDARAAKFEAEMVATAKANFDATVTENKDVLGAGPGAEQVKELRTQLEALQEKLKTGAITASDFAKAADQLVSDIKFAAEGLRWDPVVDGMQALHGELLQLRGEGAEPAIKAFEELQSIMAEAKSLLPAEEFKALGRQAIDLAKDVMFGRKSIDEFREAIKDLSEQASAPLRAQALDSVQDALADKARADAIGELPDFEFTRGLLDTPHLGDDAVRAIGSAVTGATKDMVDKLVADFNALKDSGNLTSDALDDLVIGFMQAAKAAEEEKKRKEKEAKDRQKAIEDVDASDLKDRIASDVVGPAMSAQFTAAVDDLKSKLNSGAISIDQFRKGIQNIQHAADAVANVKDRLEDLDDLPADKLEDFKSQLDALAQSLADGEISAYRFDRAVKSIEESANEAANAARKAAEEEKRRRILAGDFSVLDPMAALQERLFQLRMQQFNYWVDQMFNGFVALNPAIWQTSAGFIDLSAEIGGAIGAIGDFGASLGHVDPGAVGGAFNTLAAWMQSQQGAIVSLLNQIQLLQQTLNHFGESMGARRRIQLIDQIAELTRQLELLTAPRAPQFVGTTGDGIFRDPGLQTQTTNVQFEFPNLTRLGNQDIVTIVDQIEFELRRRGRRL